MRDFQTAMREFRASANRCQVESQPEIIDLDFLAVETNDEAQYLDRTRNPSDKSLKETP